MENDVSCTELPKSRRWFAPVAQTLMVVATMLTGTYTFQQVMEGKFPWWPYPAFALFTVIVLYAHWLVSREEE